jgi:hypothetical protein
MKLFRRGPDTPEPQFSFAPDGETVKRSREVQLLVNVIEPDPKMQPWFISDEGRVFDICSLQDEEIRGRLAGYFRGPIRADLEVPLWRLADLLKAEFPGWPDAPPWERP